MTSSRRTSPHESAIVKRILDYLRSRGAFAEKIHGDKFQTTLLDIICCYRGYFLHIEVKRPGEDLSTRQSYIVKQVLDAGGIAFRAESVSQVQSVIAEIDDAAVRSQSGASRTSDATG